ncbi:MAG: carbohydrate kinase family protein, partial [Candidatus Parcubacteria bacterium]|nr:carbohydrate kinase family protein [Candidatus Parcubacteria bacterium]
MKYDIITFGSATRDVFLISEKLAGREGLCLNPGSKVNIDNLLLKLGGGGINTATAFSNQGFKTAFCGMIGNDRDGDDIVKELIHSKIDTGLLRKTAAKPTNYSLIIASPGFDRTILAYRGAAGEMGKKDIPWNKLDAKWFYLSPLSGKICNLTLNLVEFAKKNKIKVAFNPGQSQLAFPVKVLEAILRKVDILILNQEEASFLTKIPYRNENKIFKKL